MIGLKIVNGIVANAAVFDKLPEGWVEAPEGVGTAWLDNGDGTFSAPPQPEPEPPTSEELRDAALASLVHDFGDGRIIQCRPHPFSDESNMRNAIEQMGRLGQSDRVWFAADNTGVTVTPAELQTAIESGQDQSSLVWAKFFSDIGD